MTRAKTEFTLAVAAALVLAAMLATWQGQRTARTPDAAISVDGSIVTPGTFALTSDADSPLPAVQSTTVLAGPLPGTIHEPVAPEEESGMLQSDRAYIAEAFPVLSSWDAAEVKPLLAASALDASTDADLQEVMSTLGARLGDLQYFDQPQPVEGADTIEYTETAAELQPYHFTAWYEAGAAEVNLVLERQAERNAVYSFDIHISN